jgi:hypothetical protein
VLDLFVAADVARQRMDKKVLAKDAPAKPAPPKRSRARGAAVRSSSAAALRGLAELIEPSGHGAVSG